MNHKNEVCTPARAFFEFRQQRGYFVLFVTVQSVFFVLFLFFNKTCVLCFFLTKRTNNEQKLSQQNNEGGTRYYDSSDIPGYLKPESPSIDRQWLDPVVVKQLQQSCLELRKQQVARKDCVDSCQTISRPRMTNSTRTFRRSFTWGSSSHAVFSQEGFDLSESHYTQTNRCLHETKTHDSSDYVSVPGHLDLHRCEEPQEPSSVRLNNTHIRLERNSSSILSMETLPSEKTRKSQLPSPNLRLNEVPSKTRGEVIEVGILMPGQLTAARNSSLQGSSGNYPKRNRLPGPKSLNNGYTIEPQISRMSSFRRQALSFRSKEKKPRENTIDRTEQRPATLSHQPIDHELSFQSEAPLDTLIPPEFLSSEDKEDNEPTKPIERKGMTDERPKKKPPGDGEQTTSEKLIAENVVSLPMSKIPANNNPNGFDVSSPSHMNNGNSTCTKLHDDYNAPLNHDHDNGSQHSDKNGNENGRRRYAILRQISKLGFRGNKFNMDILNFGRVSRRP